MQSNNVINDTGTPHSHLVRLMTHTVHCIFAIISLWYHITYRLTHCLHFVMKIASANETPLYICGETVHTHFECTTTMGEALINLVCQYPALWDKQDVKYKDSNCKEAKWKEYCWNFMHSKGRCDKEVEIFEGHFCETEKHHIQKQGWLKWLQTEVEVLWHPVLPWYYTT